MNTLMILNQQTVQSAISFVLNVQVSLHSVLSAEETESIHLIAFARRVLSMMGIVISAKVIYNFDFNTNLIK